MRTAADSCLRASHSGLKHGQHVDFTRHRSPVRHGRRKEAIYGICSRPVDTDARLSNLLLTMLQRVDVEADQFYDSLGTVSSTRDASLDLNSATDKRGLARITLQN